MKLCFKFIILFSLFFLSNFLFAANDNSNKITGFRFSEDSSKTRLVFESKNHLTYKIFSLQSPERIVVDIKNVSLLTSIDQPDLNNQFIKNIRFNESQSLPSNLRLTLDLKKTVKFKAFQIGENKKNRLVIDLFLIADEKSQRPEKNVAINREHRSRPIVVVIDPGHGGRDPGAVGPSGVMEKDVVLKIAKKLKSYLDMESTFKAYLVRDGDYYVNLRKRLHIAHLHKADFFISIHADACRKVELQGVSVYALSQRGATSEMARWLAEKENESELGSVIADKSVILKTVLLDLAQTSTINDSLSVGKSLLQKLSLVTEIHMPNIEQAAFVVLKSPDIPSLLVETGFISNFFEEKRLDDSYHQRKIAYALALGIKNYFAEHPKYQ